MFAAFDDMFKSLLFVATSSGALFWAQLAFQCAATIARGWGLYSDLFSDWYYATFAAGPESTSDRERRVQRACLRQ